MLYAHPPPITDPLSACTMSKVKILLLVELVLLVIILIWTSIATAVLDWAKSGITEYGIWRFCSMATGTQICMGVGQTGLTDRRPWVGVCLHRLRE